LTWGRTFDGHTAALKITDFKVLPGYKDLIMKKVRHRRGEPGSIPERRGRYDEG
jgi:hypothetical protein